MLILGPSELEPLLWASCAYFLTAATSNKPLPSAVCHHLVTIKITSQFGQQGSDNAQAPR